MNIEKFFSIIKDGEWHRIDELSDRLGLPISRLAEFSKLLSEHGLLKHEEKTGKIKIESLWKLLLPEQDEPAETKTTVASFVIPPETSIDVQSTHISNMSNVELEVDLRIDNRIKEVAIRI